MTVDVRNENPCAICGEHVPHPAPGYDFAVHPACAASETEDYRR